MIEIVKTRKQQLEERIKQLEGFIFSEDTPYQLKKIYEDHAKYLREELKQYE